VSGTWLGAIRAATYRSRIEERASFYLTLPARGERESLQLQWLNAEWERATRSVPYFGQLQKSTPLPPRFASLDEFTSLVPPMNRRTLQEHRQALVGLGRKPDFFRITGGSTAQPIQVPSWNEELRSTIPDLWTARKWYGIDPASRLFLLWGHSHLLGSGVAGWLRARQRQVFDRLLGYRRFSAYDLRPEVLRRAAEVLVHFKPDYLVGYSVALDLLARAAADLRSELRATGLRMVVGSAEGFPTPDSASRLEDLFDCPVGMEYGAVETNLMAHTHPDGGYRVFWHSYLLERGEAPEGSIRVTSLYPRCVPLLRYEIGDQIEPWPEDTSRVGLASFQRVIGRCNDYVLMPDQTPIHSEAFTHAIRPCAAIGSYQVVQDGERIELRFTAARDLTPQEEVAIRERLHKVHGGIEKIPLVRTDRLKQTIAGKTPMILRRS
jgi:phenylacetate-coenzyme A ligase PaaK-like adenylate-forming protein